MFLIFVLVSLYRQELIVCLKKAKASCGLAGFRGMQIPDVVKCVEDLVQLEVNRAVCTVLGNWS